MASLLAGGILAPMAFDPREFATRGPGIGFAAGILVFCIAGAMIIFARASAFPGNQKWHSLNLAEPVDFLRQPAHSLLLSSAFFFSCSIGLIPFIKESNAVFMPFLLSIGLALGAGAGRLAFRRRFVGRISQ